jgi:hypothetical protein
VVDRLGAVLIGVVLLLAQLPVAFRMYVRTGRGSC